MTDPDGKLPAQADDAFLEAVNFLDPSEQKRFEDDEVCKSIDHAQHK
jgi:hypothetical protein